MHVECNSVCSLQVYEPHLYDSTHDTSCHTLSNITCDTSDIIHVMQMTSHHTQVTCHTSDVTCHTPGDDLVTEVEPFLQSVDVKHDNLCGPSGSHRDDRQHVREGLGEKGVVRRNAMLIT